MNIFHYFKNVIMDCLKELQRARHLPQDADLSKITAEPPRDPSHGDISTNAAMILSKSAGCTPAQIAALLKPLLEANPNVASCTMAGPGFMNITLSDAFIAQQLPLILAAGLSYGDSDGGAGEKVNVEYVSTNPTGPIHIGHARGAIIGDVLSTLLKKAGYAVTKEYYVNDAGAQTDQLARSVYAHYCRLYGRTDVDPGAYPGEYLIPVGEALAQQYGEAFVDQPESVWLTPIRTFAVAAMMDLIRQDLAILKIEHDVFTSERTLVAQGRVDEAFAFFQERDLIYTGVLEAPKGKLPDDWEPRAQQLFRATTFGDDVDRPLQKSDGSWTYFAGDIGYHLDKFDRGFNRMIAVWGADHGGYVKRLSSAVQAITDQKGMLEVKLCQMVKFLQDGHPMKMSKRAGNFITVEEVVEAVGTDVIRFIMMTRKNDAPLDFDLSKVVEHSKDNPVFYVQYAHARCCSIRRHAQELFPQVSFEASDLARQTLTPPASDQERALILLLAHWPRQIEAAAATTEPHRLAYYLHDVASAFHALWAKGKEDAQLRFIFPDDMAKTIQKLALTQAVATVIASGLAVFGVRPSEEMR